MSRISVRNLTPIMLLTSISEDDTRMFCCRTSLGTALLWMDKLDIISPTPASQCLLFPQSSVKTRTCCAADGRAWGDDRARWVRQVLIVATSTARTASTAVCLDRVLTVVRRPCFAHRLQDNIPLPTDSRPVRSPINAKNVLDKN